MNDLWDFDPDGPDGPDPVVTAALRSMEPPAHDESFWQELEARLAAETTVDPTAAVPVVAPPAPPPDAPLAEVVPLPRSRPRPQRWLAAVAAIVVVALGIAALVRTSDTDVEMKPATTSMPTEPVTSAPPTIPTPTATAAPVSSPTTAATAPATTLKPAAPSTVAPRRTTTTAPANATPFTLSLAGVGPLRLGMTLQQATATGAVGSYEDFSGNGTCGVGYGAKAYDSTDFAALFLDGRLAIFYAERDSRLRSPQGIGIGSPASKLSSVPGTRSERPHPYGAGTNVDIMSGDVGYRFTVDQGTVQMWSVGTKAGLALTEACS